MSHSSRGPLATYNSLTDRHLAGFFANTRVREHLRKSGLITTDGEIINDATYRLNMARKDHKKHVKDLLAQAIVHKTLDIERLRQIEVKRRLEEIAKLETVKRIRQSRDKKNDDNLLPLLSPTVPAPQRMQSARNQRVCRPASYVIMRPTSAPDGQEGSTTAKSSHQGGEPRQGDNLDELPTDALRDYAITMNYEQQKRKDYNPYKVPQIPLPPKRDRTNIQTAKAQRMRQREMERALKMEDRPTTASVEVRRPMPPVVHMPVLQSYSTVVMRYHGYGLNLVRQEIDPRQEIMVDQQHCGGNTRTVFKEMLAPGSEFKFSSLRHQGYPFSLTLYIDGKVDCRVSTCCEFGHKCGRKLGHFSFVSIEGSSAKPCYKCQMGFKRPPSYRRQLRQGPKQHLEVVTVITTKLPQASQQGEAAPPGPQPAAPKEENIVVAVEKDEGEMTTEEPEKSPRPVEEDERKGDGAVYTEDFEEESKHSKEDKRGYDSDENERSEAGNAKLSGQGQNTLDYTFDPGARERGLDDSPREESEAGGEKYVRIQVEETLDEPTETKATEAEDADKTEEEEGPVGPRGSMTPQPSTHTPLAASPEPPPPLEAGQLVQLQPALQTEANDVPASEEPNEDYEDSFISESNEGSSLQNKAQSSKSETVQGSFSEPQRKSLTDSKPDSATDSRRKGSSDSKRKHSDARKKTSSNTGISPELKPSSTTQSTPGVAEQRRTAGGRREEVRYVREMEDGGDTADEVSDIETEVESPRRYEPGQAEEASLSKGAVLLMGGPESGRVYVNGAVVHPPDSASQPSRSLPTPPPREEAPEVSHVDSRGDDAEPSKSKVSLAHSTSRSRRPAAKEAEVPPPRSWEGGRLRERGQDSVSEEATGENTGATYSKYQHSERASMFEFVSEGKEDYSLKIQPEESVEEEKAKAPEAEREKGQCGDGKSGGESVPQDAGNPGSLLKEGQAESVAKVPMVISVTEVEDPGSSRDGQDQSGEERDMWETVMGEENVRQRFRRDSLLSVPDETQDEKRLMLRLSTSSTEDDVGEHYEADYEDDFNDEEQSQGEKSEEGGDLEQPNLTQELSFEEGVGGTRAQGEEEQADGGSSELMHSKKEEVPLQGSAGQSKDSQDGGAGRSPEDDGDGDQAGGRRKELREPDLQREEADQTLDTAFSSFSDTRAQLEAADTTQESTEAEQRSPRKAASNSGSPSTASEDEASLGRGEDGDDDNEKDADGTTETSPPQSSETPVTRVERGRVPDSDVNEAGRSDVADWKENPSQAATEPPRPDCVDLGGKVSDKDEDPASPRQGDSGLNHTPSLSPNPSPREAGGSSFRSTSLDISQGSVTPRSGGRLDDSRSDYEASRSSALSQDVAQRKPAVTGAETAVEASQGAVMDFGLAAASPPSTRSNSQAVPTAASASSLAGVQDASPTNSLTLDLAPTKNGASEFVIPSIVTEDVS